MDSEQFSNMVKANQESYIIPFSNGRIHYSIFGNGAVQLIAFHGFGQDGSTFQKFADRFPVYRIYALDLPFHGKSMLFDVGKPIGPYQVAEIIMRLAETQKIDRFSIMTFSMGSRFAWPLLGAFSQRLESVTLIAPDGLPTSSWYRLATFNKISRYLFRIAMDNEDVIAGIIKVSDTLGITDRQMSIYMQKIVGTAEVRRRIYNTWTALRYCEPDKAMLANLIRNNNTKVQIVLGEKDNLIRSKNVIRYLKGIQGVEILLLPCQHHQLMEKFFDWKMEEEKGASA